MVSLLSRESFFPVCYEFFNVFTYCVQDKRVGGSDLYTLWLLAFTLFRAHFLQLHNRGTHTYVP